MTDNDLKILFDATCLSSYNKKSGHRAGIFFVAINLLKEFQKMGIDVTLYCEPLKRYKIKNIKIFKNIKLFNESSLLNKFTAFVFYIFSGHSKFIDNVLRVAERVYYKHIQQPNKKNIALINKYSAYFSPFTPASKDIELSAIKKFRLIHDIIPIIENNMTENMPSWYYWYNRVYSTINDSDYYFTNSEHTKKDLLEYFPFIKEDHVKTTLLGANELFHISNGKSPIEGKYVFSLCTLGKRKNITFGIKNFFEFTKKHNINDLKLVLGGSVWKRYEKELYSVINQYDRSKIIMAGYLEEEDLPKYYSNALCFIYPSLYEGFGLPVLEAMQCGCPVITSNTTSLPEVIGEAGIQIDPKSDSEIIEAFEKMYFDSDFRKECRRKGLERSKLFSWEKCAKEILNFIESKNTPNI